MATALSPELALAGDGISAVPPVILDPCVVCGVQAKAAQGRLSRCLGCIKVAAAEDRAARAAAEATLAEKLRQTTKSCRACGKAKPFNQFAKHRLAKDGHRRDCRQCVAADRGKRKALTDEQKARDRELRQQPHRKAANLESAVAWQARNPAAVRAARTLDADVRHGKIMPATVCEAEGCEGTGRLSGHHNSYVRRRVAWLCAKHHRLCHSGVPLRLKQSAALRVARAPKTA